MCTLVVPCLQRMLCYKSIQINQTDSLYLIEKGLRTAGQAYLGHTKLEHPLVLVTLVTPGTMAQNLF